ncbi:MAG: hypothetical protein R3E86_22635, partial [Pseudomonadales bacterium]
MRTSRRIGCVLVLLGTLAACSDAPAPSSTAIVIDNVTVIDAVAGARPGQRVVIDGDRILSVGPMTEPRPAASEVRDGGGRYLIPGLWDMHVHFLYEPALTGGMADQFLRYGVTSVRDTGGDLAQMVALRAGLEARAAAPDGRPVPRLFFAGPLLDGRFVVYDGADPDQPPLGTAVPDVAAARATVQRLRAAGADFIKVYELVS